MSAASSKLHRVGVAIQAALQADDGQRHLVSRARRRLVAEFMRSGASRAQSLVFRVQARRRRSYALGLALALGCTLLGIWAWTEREISFRVRTAPGAVSPQLSPRLGDVIAARDEGVDVHFSEGSTVSLRPQASARVLSAAGERVRILLEQGELHAAIAQHPLGARGWDFEAGPFRVRASGTALHLVWSATAGVLTLTSNGAVQVAAACLGYTREVYAGARLELACSGTYASTTAPNDDVLSSNLQ